MARLQTYCPDELKNELDAMATQKQVTTTQLVTVYARLGLAIGKNIREGEQLCFVDEDGQVRPVPLSSLLY